MRAFVDRSTSRQLKYLKPYPCPVIENGNVQAAVRARPRGAGGPVPALARHGKLGGGRAAFETSSVARSGSDFDRPPPSFAPLPVNQTIALRAPWISFRAGANHGR